MSKYEQSPTLQDQEKIISATQKEQKNLTEKEGGVISLLEKTFPEVEIEPQIKDIYQTIWKQNPYSLFPKYRREDVLPKGDFSKGHQEINNQIIKNVLPFILDKKIWALALGGPMHAGKTRLIDKLLGILRKEGYLSEFYVINTMGDKFVVADGDKPKKIEAKRFGGKFLTLPNRPESKDKVCALDEYTFGDIRDVTTFAQSNYAKGIFTIFSGLIKNYLGAVNQPSKDLSDILEGIQYISINCKAYIHGIDNIKGRGVANLTGPSGDSTVRHIRTINPYIDLLDAGLFDTIISKEKHTLGGINVVDYAPTQYIDTPYYHLQKYPEKWQYISIPERNRQEDPEMGRRDKLRHQRTQWYINNY